MISLIIEIAYAKVEYVIDMVLVCYLDESAGVTIYSTIFATYTKVNTFPTNNNMPNALCPMGLLVK